MRNYKHILSVITCIYLACSPGYAQPVHQYNVNIYNGLPSNHVYYLCKDRLGYLWIATDNGVVKYNGYTFKRFGIAEGLPNDDVWRLVEDNKGRMWLLGIANEIGYVRNNVYKKAVLQNKTNEIYPIVFEAHDSSVSFLFTQLKNIYKPLLYTERQDTFHLGKIPVVTDEHAAYSMDNKGNLYLLARNGIYRKSVYNKEEFKLVLKTKDKFTENVVSVSRYITYRDKVIAFNYIYDKNTFNVFDINHQRDYVVKLSNDTSEGNLVGIIYNDLLEIISNKGIYVFAPEMNLIKSYRQRELFSDTIKGNYALNVLDDDFWGLCIGSVSNGLYINDSSNRFKQINALLNYTYVGYSANSIHFWWNKTDKQLLCRYKTGIIKYIDGKMFYDINKIVPYNEGQSIVLSSRGIFRLNSIDNRIRPFFDSVKYNSVIDNNRCRVFEYPYNRTSGAVGCRIVNDNEIYFALRHEGLLHCMRSNDTVYETGLSYGRLSDLIYDTLKKEYWLLGDKIIRYKDGQSNVITDSILGSFKIKRIEKILYDTQYGNLFIKDYNKLLVYNTRSGKVKEIYKNYRLENATPYLHNNTLIVVGKFGILFSKNRDDADVSEPLLYENRKNASYFHVKEMGVEISPRQVVLNTDKGTYSVDMPSDSLLMNVKPVLHKYKLVLTYNDSTKELKKGELININQSDNALLLDIINPAGNGTPQYTYYIENIGSSWQNLNDNELHLPQLRPGKYYIIHVIVSDEVWRSDELTFRIYIIPQWWQTKLWRGIFLLLGLVLALMIVWLIIYITKRRVIKKHAKQSIELELSNLQMALELKSIYAQINPHFIFNALNTGLLYIKKRQITEAYTHISAFAGLLRAYIKSSRNKFILLEEEIENLKNYIMLQEARFKNRFNYQIIVENKLQSSGIRIPSLLLQPLVENAISHGLFHKEGVGNLKVEFKEGTNENELVCIVDDDGIGREMAARIQNDSEYKTQSYGTDLIKDLISIFNKYEPIRIDISYIDKVLPLTGTSVIVTINFLEHESR